MSTYYRIRASYADGGNVELENIVSFNVQQNIYRDADGTLFSLDRSWRLFEVKQYNLPDPVPMEAEQIAEEDGAGDYGDNSPPIELVAEN